MLRENVRLKYFLVIQSFSPLFILLLLKYLDISAFIRLSRRFFEICCINGLGAAMLKTLSHTAFGGLVVSLIGVVWIAFTIVVVFQYGKIQNSGFDSHGESIHIGEAPNDSGATFLVTYVLPLLTDDLTTTRGLVVFLVLLGFVIRLLSHSNTFYQNPILAALNYRTFFFQFNNPYQDIPGGTEKIFIGITKGTSISEEAVVKRKYIADGVFMIYNE